MAENTGKLLKTTKESRCVLLPPEQVDLTRMKISSMTSIYYIAMLARMIPFTHAPTLDTTSFASSAAFLKLAAEKPPKFMVRNKDEMLR